MAQHSDIVLSRAPSRRKWIEHKRRRGWVAAVVCALLLAGLCVVGMRSRGGAANVRQAMEARAFERAAAHRADVVRRVAPGRGPGG